MGSYIWILYDILAMLCHTLGIYYSVIHLLRSHKLQKVITVSFHVNIFCCNINFRFNKKFVSNNIICHTIQTLSRLIVIITTRTLFLILLIPKLKPNGKLMQSSHILLKMTMIIQCVTN